MHLTQEKFPYLTHDNVRSISHHVSKEHAFILIHLWKQAPLALRHQSILSERCQLLNKSSDLVKYPASMLLLVKAILAHLFKGFSLLTTVYMVVKYILVTCIGERLERLLTDEQTLRGFLRYWITRTLPFDTDTFG